MRLAGRSGTGGGPGCSRGPSRSSRRRSSASPALARQLALPSPPASSVRVTVNPPGPHSPAGTIASGLIGTQPWSARIEYPGTAKCAVGGTDVTAYNCKGTLPTANGDPISFPDFGVPDNNTFKTGRTSFLIEFGLVEQDVTSARLVLADGTVLTLHPVTVDGSRWVAFAAPIGVPVDSVTAYSRTGEIATAIPYSYAGAGSPSSPVAAARPGGAKAADRNDRFGNARWHRLAGDRLRGPLGHLPRRRRQRGGPHCFASHHPGNRASTWARRLVGDGRRFGVTLMITLKDGSTVRVGVTAVGRQKFWGVSLSEKAVPGCPLDGLRRRGQARSRRARVI